MDNNISNSNGVIINTGNNNISNLNGSVVIGSIRSFNNNFVNIREHPALSKNNSIIGNRDIISSFNNVIVDDNNFVNIGEQPALSKNNSPIENKIKLPVEEIDEICINPDDFKVEEICSICMERKINTVIVDCGHRCVCFLFTAI